MLTPADYAAARRLADAAFHKFCREHGTEANAADLMLLHQHRQAAKSPRALSAIISKGRELQAPHLDLIDQAVIDLADGRTGRVGLFMPPRHGKSRRVRWCALWYLMHHPDHRILIATYGQTLSDQHGRWLRDTVSAHSDILGFRLRESSRSASRWDVEGTEGGLLATSVGGAATGTGADVLLIDDPVRDSQDAESLLIQERTWDWWASVAQTRLEPGGRVILIQTRWSPGDLGGRILADEPERWRTVDLPAVVPTVDEYAALGVQPEPDPLGRREGDALWPARYPAVELAKIRRSVGERVWWALYQQQPRPPSGALVSRADMDAARVPYAPDVVRTAVAVDPSGGGRDTAGIIGGRLAVDGKVYVTDDRSGRMSSDRWAREACLLAHELGSDVIVVEKNFGGDMPKRLLFAAWKDLCRTGEVEGVCPDVREVSARRGKFLRAEPIGQQIRLGNVRLVSGLGKVEYEWISWSPEVSMSPGRIDASVYLAYHLLPPAEGPARVHSPARAGQQQASPGRSGGSVWGQRVG